MRTINANTLKKMFLSASNNLFNHYREVDALNVFPVPDGDTGMNMNLTLTSGANEIINLNEKSVYNVSKAFARGLLMGARGNSGVITSQIFKGFSVSLENVKELDAIALAAAFTNAYKTAYAAVLKPVEGTILTVIRETAESFNSAVKEGLSIERCFSIILASAKSALKRTPELLPILKEVGVVDSGGAGLVVILEGMQSVLKGKFIDRNEENKLGGNNALSAAAKSMDQEEFGYCTEFIMRLGPDSTKKAFNKAKFVEFLDAQGVSLVVVHDEDIVKVHIHTMEPGKVLNFAQEYGEFLKLKIENMTEQHHALETGAMTEEKEEETPADRVPYAIIAVSSGEGIDAWFKELGASVIVGGGQTMNPSSEDFVAAIKKANADNIYILPNNSNIVMAASQACEIVENEVEQAYVVPSKTIMQGMVSLLTFSPDAKPQENFLEMKAALKNIKSGEVTFSIRDCELNGIKINKDDFIGIFEKDIVVGTNDKLDCLYQLLDKMIDDESALITIVSGQDVEKETLDIVKKELKNKYPDVDFDIKEGKQPVYSFLIGVE